MPQPSFTPTAMDEALGFTGSESDADLGVAYEDDVPPAAEPPAPPAPDPAQPPAPPAPPAAPDASAQPPAAPPAPPAAPDPQPSLKDVLALMEAQATRQTQILERAIPQPQAAPAAPRPLPVIPEQYRGVIDEDTIRGAQVVMDILGITPKLERLEAFETQFQQKESGNAAGQFIIGQVPEMSDPAFQQEVTAEIERNFDSAGVPKDQRAQFLNPFLFVQAGNAVKARRSQSAAPTGAAPTPPMNQALAARAGGEVTSEPVAASVADASQQPVDWMNMSEEDYARAQAAILRKQNGSW